MSATASRTPLRLVGIWAGLLIALMALRPSPRSPAFWLVVAFAMLFGGAYMLLSHRESKRDQFDVEAWLEKIAQLVDVPDFQDDGHLSELLDESERRRIVEELERMPAGSRSLRRAIGVVSPDLIGGDA